MFAAHKIPTCLNILMLQGSSAVARVHCCVAYSSKLLCMLRFSTQPVICRNIARTQGAHSVRIVGVLRGVVSVLRGPLGCPKSAMLPLHSFAGMTNCRLKACKQCLNSRRPLSLHVSRTTDWLCNSIRDRDHKEHQNIGCNLLQHVQEAV